jgi:hypothetical protein
MDLGSTLAWVPVQVLITGIVPAVVWIAGLIRVLRDPEARPYQFLGIAYLVLAVVFAVSAGDKPYYAAGCTSVVRGRRGAGRAMARTAPAWGLARPAAIAALGLTTLLLVPAAIPVLPAATFADSSINEANPEMGEQVGWPDLAREVARVWDRIPARDRRGPSS